MMASDVQYVVKALAGEAVAPWTIDEARKTHEQTADWLTPQDMRPPVALIEEIILDGVKARVYRPAADDVPRPTLLWFHGGGWMTGSLDTADIIARTFASAANAVVVTPQYRLAPEHLWPAGLNDARAVYGWVTSNIDRLGGDPSRMVIGGDSAGGNLAAVLALESRGTQPRLAAQVLIYPVVDLDLTTTSYPSRTAFAKGYHLELADVIQCVTTYLPATADVSDPSVSPIRSTTFAGLPPTVIATADLDPLRDEGRLYAEKLQEAGVRVHYLNTPGLVHGGFDMLGVSPTARSAMAMLVDSLTQLLSHGPASNRATHASVSSESEPPVHRTDKVH